MVYALRLFSTGMVDFMTGLVPAREAPLFQRDYNFLPTITPTEALSGDIFRVGVQLKLAQKAHGELKQEEFRFCS
jgi:hypothetical protein